MKKSKTDFLAVVCYIALIVAAIIVLLTNLLPLCGVELTGKFWGNLKNLLYTVRDVSLLIAMALGAHAVSKKGKAWLVIYVIAVIIFAIAIVLYWF